jgi:hypothetical protein
MCKYMHILALSLGNNIRRFPHSWFQPHGRNMKPTGRHVTLAFVKFAATHTG